VNYSFKDVLPHKSTQSIPVAQTVEHDESIAMVMVLISKECMN